MIDAIATNQLTLRAIPFVPGRAKGSLIIYPDRWRSYDLVLLSQESLNSFIEIAHLSPPAGIIMCNSAPLSHPMIHLFGLGVPAIMISDQQQSMLKRGMELYIDGTSGLLSSASNELAIGETIPSYLPLAGSPIKSLDNQDIELRASVGSIDAVTQALKNGATSIGSVRSEYFFPQSDSKPDFTFYNQAINNICKEASPLTVNLRLIDLAVDKQPAWLGALGLIISPLGLRGSRLYHLPVVQEVLCAEINAIAQVARYFPMRVSLPFVEDPAVFDDWRKIIHDKVGYAVAVGVMLETPAAVLAIKEWSNIADFVGIGCNDLMQYLFAADRNNPAVSELLDPYSPVLFRFLNSVAIMAGDYINQVQLCGLLPQFTGILPALMGMGFRNFTVEPGRIPYLAQIVSETDTRLARKTLTRVCDAADSRTVRQLIL